ncbi:hypothetical protein PCAR4_290012 [Paraburkholderia caribensis]|nr:hypothetical protein PCAR4_290012 [Paraburkholderia caribensis]
MLAALRHLLALPFYADVIPAAFAECIDLTMCVLSTHF